MSPETIQRSFVCCGFGTPNENLTKDNTYWLALPSLQNQIENTEGVERLIAENGFYDNREISDNNHPSVYLFTADDAGMPNQENVNSDNQRNATPDGIMSRIRILLRQVGEEEEVG